MDYSQITVLLVDGADRQTLPLAKAYRKLGCKVATVNGSKLDLGYTSKYPTEKIIDPLMKKSKADHLEIIKSQLKTGKFDVVVTTSDDTAEQLSLIRTEYEKYAKFTINYPDLFYMAYDKNKTMRVCMEEGIPCPKTYFGVKTIDDLPTEELQFPIVVKPASSFGAMGFHRVDSKEQLNALFEELSNDAERYVFQEYIPQTDIQYECAMFVDQNNEVKTACVFSKNRWFPVNGGSSTCNVTVERPDIVESCTKLLKAIGWRGAADIDLIQDPRDNVAKIMEINPRVSGSIKVVLDAGVNIAQQMVELACNEVVTPYLEYKSDVRLRCIHTDLLWFLKSPERFKSNPSWFSWKRTSDQVWSLTDPVPFLAYSVQALARYKSEMKKRS